MKLGTTAMGRAKFDKFSLKEGLIFGRTYGTRATCRRTWSCSWRDGDVAGRPSKLGTNIPAEVETRERHSGEARSPVAVEATPKTKSLNPQNKTARKVRGPQIATSIELDWAKLEADWERAKLLEAFEQPEVACLVVTLSFICVATCGPVCRECVSHIRAGSELVTCALCDLAACEGCVSKVLGRRAAGAGQETSSSRIAEGQDARFRTSDAL